MPKKLKKTPVYHADGELPEPIQIDETRSIDEIMGGEGPNAGPFGTHDTEEYKRRLSEMTLTDIQKECVARNIWPKDRIDYNINQLVLAHQRYVSRSHLSREKPIPSPKATKEIADFMDSAKSSRR